MTPSMAWLKVTSSATSLLMISAKILGGAYVLLSTFIGDQAG
jgi:hypothetical protein